MRSFCLALVVLAAMIRPAHAEPDNLAARAQIERVVEIFRTSIIAKDKSTLGSLFMPTGGSWIKVMDDETYQQQKAKQPSVAKLKPGTYQDFADFLGASHQRLEEKFSNVGIDTDGAVASVYFHFVFLVDDKETNRGNETWQLVNTGDGWKINALIYSTDQAKL
jgi:hypothetical protein